MSDEHQAQSRFSSWRLLAWQGEWPRGLAPAAGQREQGGACTPKVSTSDALVNNSRARKTLPVQKIRLGDFVPERGLFNDILYNRVIYIIIVIIIIIL